MKELAIENLNYADRYLDSIEAMYNSENRRFNNDLLYNMITISHEKFMISLLAHYDTIANSHLPLMMYREAKVFEPKLDEDFRKMAIFIGSFEGICSIDDFGYRTPDDSQIEKMIVGLKDLRALVTLRVNE